MKFTRVWLRSHRNEILLSLASFVMVGTLLIILGLAIHPSDETKWHDPNTQFDSELGWSTIPSRSLVAFEDKTISSNALGFRSPEFDENTPTIFMVGDSVAYGLGVSDHETAGHYLSQRVSGMQVQNASVSGYGIDQYYLTLQRNVNTIKPKTIFVILFTGNDRENTISNSSYGASKPLFTMQSGTLTLEGVPIAKNSCMNDVSRSLLWKIGGKLTAFNIFATMEEIKNSVCGKKTLSEEEGSRVIASLLKKIIQLGNEHGASVHFVLSPQRSDVESPGEKLVYFRNLFHENQIPFHDLTDSLSTVENVDAFFLDTVHYSPAGNQWLAQQLYTQMNEAD